MALKLTDAQVTAAAAQSVHLKAKAAELLAAAKLEDDKLLAEVARRKATVTTSKGDTVAGIQLGALKILVIAGKSVTYDYEKAKARVGQAKALRLSYRVITRRSVEAALDGGLIDQADVDAFATETPTAAYPRVYGVASLASS